MNKMNDKYLSYLRYNTVICGASVVKPLAISWGMANKKTQYIPLPPLELIESKIVIGPVSYEIASKALANIRFNPVVNGKLIHVPAKEEHYYDQEPFMYFVDEIPFPDPDEFDMVCTRHEGLRNYFVEKGLVSPDVPFGRPRFASDVFNKTVLGILPFDLAAYTKMYARVDIDIPREGRSIEYTSKELRNFKISDPKCYTVLRVKPINEGE
jgi:hypothetical protein